MAKKNQHVVPTKDGNWGVRGEGNSKITKKTPTQSEAINIANQISKNQGSETVIHRRDGRIRDKDFHGKGPCPPKDRR